jgi:hypothetical protein
MDIKDRRGDVDATDTAMNNVECTGSAVGDDEGHLQDPVTILGSRDLTVGWRSTLGSSPASLAEQRCAGPRIVVPYMLAPYSPTVTELARFGRCYSTVGERDVAMM